MKSTVYSSRVAFDIGVRLRARRAWVHRHLSYAGLGAALVAAVPGIGIGWLGSRATTRPRMLQRPSRRGTCRVLAWRGPRVR